MKFMVEKINTEYNFSQINQGELFECNSDIFMKINEVNDAEWGAFNAVNLDDGDVDYFTNYTKVHKATAELLVKVLK